MVKNNYGRVIKVSTSVSDLDPVFLGHSDPDPDPFSTNKPLKISFGKITFYLLSVIECLNPVKQISYNFCLIKIKFA